MAGILGAGVYIPVWRVALTEISKAWGNEDIPGEISVAGLDEDLFTMAVSAGRGALQYSNIEPNKMGIICVCTGTGSKSPIASRLAFALGANSETRVMDLGLSARSTTQAILCCSDVVRAGSAKYGIVVGVDNLLPEPGSVDEMSWGAAAAAVVIGNEGMAFSIAGAKSYSSAFTERWTVPGAQFQRQTAFPRFTRDLGLHHASSAGSSLMTGLKIKPEDLSVVILQNSAVADRAAKAMNIPQGKVLRSENGKAFGDTGCAAVLLDLVESSSSVKSGDKILMISYGIGGSDAICLVAEKPENLKDSAIRLAQFRNEKTLIEYPTLLRLRRIIGPAH
jgi:3-hydroxy-3-methylglutaryl CoA synthase